MQPRLEGDGVFELFDMVWRPEILFAAPPAPYKIKTRLIHTGLIMHTSIKQMGTSAAIPLDPRVGWAQATKDLAARDDDQSVWPDFDNDEDEAL